MSLRCSKSILFLLLAYAISNVCAGCGLMNSDGDMYPMHTTIEAGSTLNLTCVVEPEKNLTWKHLRFVHYSERVNKDNEVVPEYEFGAGLSDKVHKVDNKTARLIVENSDVTMSGTWYCMADKLVCSSQVVVGYKLEHGPDINLKCKSIYRTKFQCSFNDTNTIESNYTLTLHPHAVIMPKDYANDYICRKNSNEIIRDSNGNRLAHCHWPVPISHRKYYLMVQGENVLGESSRAYIFNHTEIVQFRPLVKFNFTPENNTVDWDLGSPVHDPYISDLIVFMLTINELDPDNGQIVSKIVHHYRHNDTEDMLDLKPYTNYMLEISAKIDDVNNPYWSDPKVLRFRTLPTAPSHPPETISQAFSAPILSDQLDRNVEIYWEPLDRAYKNSDDKEFGYKIQVLPAINGKSNFTTSNTNYTFNNLSVEKEYEFRIFSMNNNGTSPDYTTIRLPAVDELEKALPPKDINVHQKHDSTRNANVYTFEWEPPAENVKNFTVFWCAERNGICVEPLEYKFVTGSSANNLSINLSNKSYKFGVSANYPEISSGIAWTKCVVDLDDRLENSLSAISQGSTSIQLKWNVRCKGHAKYLKGLSVSYCPNTENFNNCDNYDRATIKNVDLSKGPKSITGLRENTSYYFYVSSRAFNNVWTVESKTDPGTPARPELVHSPLKLKDNILPLKWTNKPWMVKFYRIKLSEVKAHVQLEYQSQDVPVDSCEGDYCAYNLVIDNRTLGFYKHFKVSVTAKNDKKQSEPSEKDFYSLPGPPSKMELKDKIVPEGDRFTIPENEPAFKNGPINKYYVKYIRKDSNKTMKDAPTYTINKGQYAKVECGEDNDVIYLVSVAAANTVNDKDLKSDFSDPVEVLLCTPVPMSYILLVAVAAGVLVAGLVIIGILKFYRKVKDDKDNFTPFIDLKKFEPTDTHPSPHEHELSVLNHEERNPLIGNGLLSNGHQSSPNSSTYSSSSASDRIGQPYMNGQSNPEYYKAEDSHQPLLSSQTSGIHSSTDGSPMMLRNNRNNSSSSAYMSHHSSMGDHLSQSHSSHHSSGSHSSSHSSEHSPTSSIRTQSSDQPVSNDSYLPRSNGYVKHDELLQDKDLGRFIPSPNHVEVN